MDTKTSFSPKSQDVRTKLDLSPAKWIWYPSERTLSNTFVLFRQEFTMEEEVAWAKGWVAADSRYLLYVNGERIQWGPAPADPRYMEADPVDLTHKLKPGKNVLAFQVLYYGFGEGTWAAGTPGLLFSLKVELKNGKSFSLHSDSSCLCTIDWSHQPGGFQRWYLRSLQEICDGRKQIPGWNQAGYTPDSRWVSAIEIGEGDIPSICTRYTDYANDGFPVTSPDTALFQREIPLLKEFEYQQVSLAEAGTIVWKKNKDHWFFFREPEVFSSSLGLDLQQQNDCIVFDLQKASDTITGSFLTFELKEQIVGFPFFSINAPEGTEIELMTAEGHALGEHLLLDNSFYCWSRYICHEGDNVFEAFDFESVKWVQLHITNPKGGRVCIKKVGIRRRAYPFMPYSFQTEDPAIQRLFEAGINTIYNAAQETIVDGMGRERQQYSGDCGHMQAAIRYALGDELLSRRFIQTYADGMTKDGLFMDSWPGMDRVKRLAYRQIGLSVWGNIVDHSIQFVFDCYKYYLASGDLECLQKPMKAFKKLIAFLMETCKGGLYPTDDRNSGFVWLDHEAYEPGNSPSKECGINLYIAGMIQKAYLPLCKIFGYSYEEMQPIQAFAESLLQQVTEKYWCDADGVFYDNLPYVSDPKERKVADRTLAMAVLFDFCKGNDTAKSIELLKGGNPAMKLSYPANAVWRMWALAKAEALEPFVEELWSVWAKMPSVLQNNTYQEFWTAYPDSCSEWSHIPAAPLLCIYEGVLGLRCNNVEGNRLSFKPQLKGFCSFETKIYNHGQEVMVQVVKQDRNRFLLSVRGENTEISITPPRGCHMVTLSSQKFQLEYQ